MATTTGEIAQFLTNRVSAFLVPPDDLPALTGALQEVTGDMASASVVGLRGRGVALRCFDYRANAPRLEAMMRDIEVARNHPSARGL